MKIALVISTYNWPAALRRCLQSVKVQTRIPDEVIIADDGSTTATKELIDAFQPSFPCPLKHAWIPDEGFRLAMSRNNAIRNYCTSDYIIFIDQDIILDKNFIYDHERIAQKGYFVTGGRTKLLQPLTDHLLKGDPFHPSLFNKGIHRKLNMLHLPFLHFITRYMYCWKPLYGRGANMAMWRADLEKINGFDEKIKGYGVEDIDIFNRLENCGIKKKYAQFCAIEYHLYHKRGTVATTNFHIAFDQPNRKRCRYGLAILPSTVKLI